MCLPTHTHDHICAIFLRGYVAASSGSETKTQSQAVSSTARASPRTGAGNREEAARTTQLLLPFTARAPICFFHLSAVSLCPLCTPSPPLFSPPLPLHQANASGRSQSPGCLSRKMSPPRPESTPSLVGPGRAWPPLLWPLQHSLLTPGLKPHTCSNGQFPSNSPTPKAGCSWIQGLRWTHHLLPSA